MQSSGYGDQTLPSSGGWSAPASSSSAPLPPSGTSRSGTFAPPGTLEVGRVLGNRYEILQLLGEGGMGAVYKARDREVDRFVALKVIRPELASRADILARFKQELILARQVTHKNVIRIFDLGEMEGLKFITMDFVEGQDLKTILREKGKFTPDESGKIIAQICRALDAAHSEGVVHRDLKPQNIMIDAKGRVTVMDFGIARSLEMTGMTQTGSLVGTPEYMSPEQAMGEDVDARSDLFTVGIIFYELLTGKTPFRAETTYATLLKRTQEQARPPIELDPSIPPQISAVVMKCLERNRDERYESALDIVHDLGGQTITMSRTALHSVARPVAPAAVPEMQSLGARLPALRHRRLLMGLGAAVVVLAAVVLIFRGRISPSSRSASSTGPQTALAILPLRNASGDSSIDWLGPNLADMLTTDLGESPHVRTIPSDRILQILHDLQMGPSSSLDPPTLRRIAEFTGAEIVVTGQYMKAGDRIRVDAVVHDLKRDRLIPLKTEAPNEEQAVAAVDQLAQSIRQNLSLSPSVVNELQAQSLKPSSKSLPALRFYNEGLELSREGRSLEAAKDFEASTKQDPQFALAYSELALTEENLGRATDAEQLSRKAIDLSATLPTEEKYLVDANQAWVMKDYAKAIASYENLAKVSPDNNDILLALAKLNEDSGALDKARGYYNKVLQADPKSANVLLALGRVAIEAGDAPGALDFLNRALSLSIETANDEEKAMVLQAIGIDYSNLNKPDDALQNYRQSLEIKRRLGEKTGIANSLEQIAQIQAGQGKPDDALKNYDEAMQIRREIGDKSGLGNVLNDLGDFYNDRGQYDKALQSFKESLQIQRDVGNENYQAMALNNIGNTYLFKGDYDNARIYFEQALTIREKFKVPSDIADTLHNLAETSTKTGQYDQAMAQYLRALELRRSAGDKRGAAIESYSLGTVFGFQGRFGPAVNSKAEALKSFRELNEGGFWLAEILSGYGESLAQDGKTEEARKTLEEALTDARDIKNDALVAQTLGYQGDNAFYSGDLKGAKALYDRALPLATRTDDRHLILTLKVGLARVGVRQAPAQAAVQGLKTVAQDADALGLKYLSVECSTLMAEVLLAKKDYGRANELLEDARARSEKLGLRALRAKTEYLLGRSLQLSGNPTDAVRHYAEARQILDDIRKEAGSDEVVKRSDLAPIYAASVPGAA